MMLRRFTTSASRQAVSRTRYAARPSRTTPRAGATATAPKSANQGSSAARPAATAPSAAATPISGSTSSAPSSVAAPRASAGNSPGTVHSANVSSPRLVPDMKIGASSTPVSETTDADTVVRNVDELEFAADAGVEPVNDWTTSYQGLGSAPFEPRVIDILLAPIVPEDVEITPDGLIYLPEIKYRRILNRAFGPGGWGIAPRTKTLVTQRQVTREYALVCLGRLVSVSRGEQDYFNAEGVTTAMEGCKSNALMRCCKDLGIASELWDPSFIREFKSKFCESKFFEKKRRFVWKRKDRAWEYPYNQ